MKQQQWYFTWTAVTTGLALTLAARAAMGTGVEVTIVVALVVVAVEVVVVVVAAAAAAVVVAVLEVAAAAKAATVAGGVVVVKATAMVVAAAASKAEGACEAAAVVLYLDCSDNGPGPDSRCTCSHGDKGWRSGRCWVRCHMPCRTCWADSCT